LNELVAGVVRFEAADRIDEDGRPCGELASRFYDEAATEIVACPYSGSRRGLPMNQTALRQAASVWPRVLAVARGLTKPNPTVHDAWKVALAGTVCPLIVGDPVPRVISAFFKTSLGFSQTLTALLLSEEGIADASLADLGDGRAFYEHLERGRWLVGQVQACAGTEAMIVQMADVLAGRSAGPSSAAEGFAEAADTASAAVGVQIAALGALYQAARGGQPIEAPDWIAEPTAPWLRGARAFPNPKPEHARRLFPAGAAPKAVETLIGWDGPEIEMAVRVALRSLG
jgi:hypothetical protein